MYEELIEALRLCVKYGKAEDALANASQAADAIEKLALELDKASNSGGKTSWIPVTERLPESGVHVLACCRVKWVGGGGRSYVCDAFYSAQKTEICSYNDDIDAEYDEETDEYYMPEGWWEVIKNWDDYSCVGIGNFVTHWMPLPEPPKEETE